MIRQFYLVDEVGQTYFFDYRNNTLVSDITDLGFSKNNTYLKTNISQAIHRFYKISQLNNNFENPKLSYNWSVASFTLLRELVLFPAKLIGSKSIGE